MTDTLCRTTKEVNVKPQVVVLLVSGIILPFGVVRAWLKDRREVAERRMGFGGRYK